MSLLWALLSFGSLLTVAQEAAETLHASLVNMRFIKPIDADMIKNPGQIHALMVTMEDNIVMSSAVGEALARARIPLQTLRLGLPDHFQDHATRGQLLADAGLDVQSIVRKIKHIYPRRDCEAQGADVLSD